MYLKKVRPESAQTRQVRSSWQLVLQDVHQVTIQELRRELGSKRSLHLRKLARRCYLLKLPQKIKKTASRLVQAHCVLESQRFAQRLRDRIMVRHDPVQVEKHLATCQERTDENPYIDQMPPPALATRLHKTPSKIFLILLKSSHQFIVVLPVGQNVSPALCRSRTRCPPDRERLPSNDIMIQESRHSPNLHHGLKAGSHRLGNLIQQLEESLTLSLADRKCASYSCCCFPILAHEDMLGPSKVCYTPGQHKSTQHQSQV